MMTRVQRWGNSLAIRIPKSLADEIGLCADSRVHVRLHEGVLVVEPVAPRAYELEDLVAGITDANRHGEVDWGASQGREVW